ncbi:hypothetical protein L1887_46961 [Cichorium endivia]|nr:hypothetical protein L1887_46961 [Cichorium endivia]
MPVPWRPGATVVTSACATAATWCWAMARCWMCRRGASIGADGERLGGKGGDITLHASASTAMTATGSLQLGGELRALGVTGAEGFSLGFAHYEVQGQAGLEVAEGAQAGGDLASLVDAANQSLTIGQGSLLQVDPGQSIRVRGPGQITVLGSLLAHGGSIDIRQQQFGDLDPAETEALGDSQANARSIWIGEHALLDVSGHANWAMDSLGRRYGAGRCPAAASSSGVRWTPNWRRPLPPMPSSSLRPGSRLEASGANAVLDIRGVGSREIASNGGSIALSSYRGLLLDGDLHAAAVARRQPPWCIDPGNRHPPGDSQALRLYGTLFEAASSSAGNESVEVQAPYVLLSGTGKYLSGTGRIRPLACLGPAFLADAGRNAECVCQSPA